MSTKGAQKPDASKVETVKALNTTTSSSSNSNGGKTTAPAPAKTNAWARPLQPKRGTTAPPPGMGLPSKSSTATSSSSLSSNSALLLQQNRGKLLHLSLTLIGERVILHQKNGAIIEGIFHTFTPFPSLPTDQKNIYVLKEILIRKQSTNGTDDILKDGVTLIVPTSKVVCVHAQNISTDLTNDDNNNNNNNNSSNSNMNGGTTLTSLGAAQGTGSDGDDAFATDTQISNSNDVRNQDLVAAGNAWTTGGGNSNSSIGNSSYRNQALGSSGGGGSGGGGPPLPTNSRAAALAGNSKSSSGTNNQQGSAATSSNMSGSIGQWDQFKANKELFNVDATFDENLYTTELDTSNMDAKKVAEAKRIAREIESTTTTNIHLAEERGFKVETDFDEEDLYSGVLTKDGKQRHEIKISKKTSNNEDGPNNDSSKPNTSTAAPRKTMNYAAAAAKKADTGKAAPPGFLASEKTTTNDNIDKEENKAESSTVVVTPEKKKTKEDTKSTQNNKPTKKEEKEKNPSKDDFKKKQVAIEKTAGTSKKDADVPSTTNDKKDVSKDETSKPADDKNSGESEKDKEKEEAKKPIKLNANAKSFSFNPTAKTFTPSFGGATNNPAPQQHPQHAAATTDPNMQMYGGGHPMQPPHYMQAGPIGQPGMVQMINPQYQGMRYPPSSYGMEQSMPQMQHQPPHMQAAPSISSAPSSGNAPTPTPGSGPSNAKEDDSKGDDASQKQGGGQHQPPQRSQQQQQSDQSSQPQGPPHQQQSQQQQIPIPYNVPPGAYFTGGIPGMPPRGPGYPQFVTGPQQIAGRPGVPPYGIYPMQPGGMPPNMQMRGPNGAPYYPGPNGPIPYPSGAHMGYPMMDDGGGADYRGGRGGRSSSSSSSSNGRGGRGSSRPRAGRGGPGRGRSNNNNNNNYNNNNNQNSTGKNTQQQYNQQPQQQQQQPPSQQQGQSAAPPANSSKSDNASPNDKADGKE